MVGGEIGQPPNRATISVKINDLVASVVPISLASAGGLLLPITCTEVQQKCVFTGVHVCQFINRKKKTWGLQQFITNNNSSNLNEKDRK